MEFADLGDLEKQVQLQAEKGEYFPEEQICLALDYLHQHHIIHRDIKLSNIFLTKSGLIKLGDFGVAKQLSNTQELANTTLGTPFYVSPEICKGEPYSYKSDIWMLGCVLFELCMLDKPFKASSLHALVRKIVDEDAPELNSRAFSRGCKELVRQLMAKNPQERPVIEEILTMPQVGRCVSELKESIPDYYQQNKNFDLKQQKSFQRIDLKLQGKSFADYLMQVQRKEQQQLQYQQQQQQSESKENQITNYVEKIFSSHSKEKRDLQEIEQAQQSSQKSFKESTNNNQFQPENNNDFKLKSQKIANSNRNSFESYRKNNYSISYSRGKVLSNSLDVHLNLQNNLERKQQITQSSQKEQFQQYQQQQLQQGKKTLSFHDILNKVEYKAEVFIDEGQNISDFLFNL